MNAVLKKLQYKGQSPVLLLDPPGEFESVAAGFEGQVDRAPAGKYPFVLAFVKSLAEAKSARDLVVEHVDDAVVFWLAYPKGTSKRYKADVNRDTGNAAMQEPGFTGVAMVSIDDDWSAMRFKRAP